MVFFDPTTTSSSKGATPPAPAPPQSPPAYGATSGSQPYPTIVHQYTYSPAPPSRYGRRSMWPRFFKALVVALLVWVLLGSLIRSIVWMVDWDHDHRGGGWGTYPVPPGLSLEKCVEPGHWKSSAWSLSASPSQKDAFPGFPYESTASFELPLSSDSLYLLARGPYASGIVDVSSSSQQTKDTVAVHLKIQYYRTEVRDAVKACAISRGPGESGVGIFTPRYLNRINDYKQRIHVHIAIVIPELDSNKWPLLIKNFESDVQNAPQVVHAIAQQVKFETLKLKSSNGRISAEALDATSAVVETSNGSISGKFNVTKQLAIETSNGHIDIRANLNNDVFDVPTKLHIRSSNGAVVANVGLFATKSSGKQHSLSEKRNPQYDVDVKTSNSRLETNFHEAPADLTLRFEGVTSNSFATAFLPPAFQGTFEIQTSNGGADVIVQPNTADPSGRGRTRRVEQSNISKTAVKGSVKWESDEKDRVPTGTATLKTSNSKVSLVL